MFIPEDDNRGTEQNTEQVLDISDAGEAFKAMFGNEVDLGTPEINEPINEAPIEPTNEVVDIPDMEPSAAISAEPQVTADTLNAMKTDIIDELRGLMQQDIPENSNEEVLEEEEPTIDSDEFMEKFAENPVLAIQELADSIADKKVAAQMNELTEKLQPVLQQSDALQMRDRAVNAITEFSQMDGFQDAEDYFQDMATYINEKGLPKDSVDSFKEAYLVAKNNALSSNKPLDAYLSDENYISRIAQHEAIRDKVIAEYLQQVASGGKPQVIGDGSPAATPRTEISSMEDAGEALKRKLGAL